MSLTQIGWVRWVLMNNPDFQISDFDEAFTNSGGKRKLGFNRPVRSIISKARNQICVRYGLESHADVPKKRDGSINVSALIRLYLEAHGPEETQKTAEPVFAADGIDLGTNQFSIIKSKWLGRGTVETVDADISPDPNQHTGPRARKSRRGRRPKSEKQAILAIRLSEITELEEQIDALIAKAESLGNSDIVNDLKNARRRASVEIIQYA